MKDNKRSFSSSQKKAVLFGSNLNCAICHEPIKPNEKINFHHVIPYSLGGKTEISNSQVVHDICNQKIGAHFSEISDLKIKLRKWQEQSLAKFLNKLYNLKNQKWVNFTMSCEPASGKTVAVLSKFHVLKKRNKANFLIVAVPANSIKPSFVRTGKNVFGLNLLEDLNNLGISRWQGQQPSDCDGIVITYHQLSVFPEAYKLLVQNNDCLVCLDECHHLAETLQWGLVCSDVFQNQCHLVSCSGTFFRTDNNKIFSLEYSDSGKILCDMRYTYLDGLRDRVLRQINFNFLDGKQRWLEDNQEVSRSFKDKLSKSDKSRVLATALKAADSKFIDEIILLMQQKIRWKKQYQHPFCKGLFICLDQSHARRVKKRIEILTDESVLLAISDNRITAEQLADFNNSSETYVVTCRMLGEGFSCPNICCIGYMTNVRQEGSVIQSIHRGTRMINGINPNYQVTEVIAPLDEKLKSIADSFEKDKERYLLEIDDKKKKIGGSSKFSTFTPLSSEAQLDTIVRVDYSKVKPANQNRQIEISPEVRERITYSDQKNKASAYNNKLVSKICRKTGETYKQVHHRSFQDGCKRVVFCSLKDLEIKRLWLENEIVRLKIDEQI